LEERTEKAAAMAGDSRTPGARVPALALDSAASPRRFSAHVAWTLSARLLMAVNSIIAGVIVARWLGAGGLGRLMVINVAVATVVQLGSLGLPSANTYFISHDRRHLATAAFNSLVFALCGGALLGAGLAGLAALYPAWFGLEGPRLLAVAAVSIPFQLLTLLGLNIFLALGRVALFNLIDLAGQSLTLLGALLALVLARAGLLALVSLNTAGAVMLALFIVWLTYGSLKRREERASLRPSRGLFRQMLRYGLKAHVTVVAAMLIFRADLLIVQYFRGAEEAGVYGVATQGATLLMLLPAVMSTLLLPRVAALGAEGQQEELTSIVTRHTAFMMALVCLAAIPASFALPWLYGRPFGDAPVQFLLLLPGVYFISIESVLVQYFNGTGLPAAIPWFWVATLLANVLLNLAWVPAYGARGAACASALCYTMIFLLVAVYFRVRTGRRASGFLVLRARELRALLALVPSGMQAGRVSADE
jgi:O-antigen/teichoic acid export membrane protein